MRKGVVALLALALGVVALAVPAMAHHSFAAEFDANKPIDLFNKHAGLKLDVKNASGTVENWGFEMGPPHGLQGRGWTRTTMKLGDEVEVAGTRAKNGSSRGNARTVTMVSTGKRLGAASSEAETP